MIAYLKFAAIFFAFFTLTSCKQENPTFKVVGDRIYIETGRLFEDDLCITRIRIWNETGDSVFISQDGMVYCQRIIEVNPVGIVTLVRAPDYYTVELISDSTPAGMVILASEVR